MAAVMGLSMFAASAYAETMGPGFEGPTQFVCKHPDHFINSAAEYNKLEGNKQAQNEVVANAIRDAMSKDECFLTDGYPATLVEKVADLDVDNSHVEVWKVKMSSPDGTESIEMYTLVKQDEVGA